MENKNVILKECSKHGLTEHVLNVEGKYRCRKCRVEHDWLKRYRLKEKLIDYKGGKCEICGYNTCIRALEFHHINPKEKEFNINANSFNRGIEILKKEADKCMLLCANCHRELHHKEEYEKKEYYAQMLNKIDKTSPLKIKLPKNDIKNDILNGMTQKEIAIKYKVSLSTIRRFFKENDLSKKHIVLTEEEVLNVYSDKMTYTETAKHFNITLDVLSKRIKDLNLLDKINKIRIEKGLKTLKGKKM